MSESVWGTVETEGDGEPARLRAVEVAVDAPGASQTYSYLLPERLADVEPGEAVLVEFGRRQALGVVLGPATSEPASAPTAGPSAPDLKPVEARVRADGPLLPELSLRFARWIAAEYLAPPAAVLRSMLPPGMLERLELIAERVPAASAATDPGFGTVAPAAAHPADPAEAELLERLEGGPRAVADLEGPDGRPAALRRLRSMAARGLVRLEWTLTAAAGGPRYERWLTLTPEGAVVAAALTERAGLRASAAPAPRLGPRQRDLLADLAAAGEMPGALAADRHGAATATSLQRRGLLAAELRDRPRRPLEKRSPGRRGTRPAGAALTPSQQAALDTIKEALLQGDSKPLLLEGVTGSGKTAIYAEAIAETLLAGRQALVLVPEVALSVPLVDRLRADLDAQIALLHSGLGEGERADEWRRIRAGGADIVVGTRTALTAPLANLGLIVVDEEHEAAYKSDRTPRLQARDAAIGLARLAGAAIVLGSATPSVESLGRAREGRYRHAVLPDRPSGAPPRVEVVDLRAELAGGNRGLLSGILVAGLEALPSGEQAILVINRRGTASVVVCRDCGHVQRCPECDRTLVYHQAGRSLRCHHCGTAAPVASRCPVCRSPRIRYLGGGTQRVEEEVRNAFPHLRVGRLDRDVAERKGAVERVLDAFAEGRLDVLVGTSLVAKGLDVPSVTLVGVVSADIALNLPDERAAERTYQLLTQSVGRAGRGERPGLAVIQTYQPDHPAIQAVATGDASAFYDAELAVRRRFGSPPFGRLVKLTVALPDRLAAEREAESMAGKLREAAGERWASNPPPAATGEAGAGEAAGGIQVLGPAPAYVARRAGRWRWNVILRGDRPLDLLVPPPGAPWSVDVDPDSLL
jgi:primosomal protein N' (replication factor Y)